jgi:hypothetical protein
MARLWLFPPYLASTFILKTKRKFVQEGVGELGTFNLAFRICFPIGD